MMVRYFKQIFLDSVQALQFITACRQLLLLCTAIIMARSSLSMSQIGFYEYILLLGNGLSGFWVNGMIQAFLADKESFRIKLPIYSSLLFLLSMLLATLLGLILWIQSEFYESSASQLIMAIAFLLFQVIGLVSEQLLVQHMKLKLSFWITLLSTSFIGIALIGLWIGDISLADFIAIQAVVYFVKCFLIFSAFKLQWIYNLREILEVVRKVMKYSLYFVISSLQPLIDGWLILWLTGQAQLLAVYRYGAREIPFLPAFSFSLGNASLPLLVQNQNVGLAQLKVISRSLIIKQSAIAFVFMFLAPIIIPFVFSKRFEESVLLFQIMLLAIPTRWVYSSTVMSACGYQSFLNRIAFIELIVNAILSIVLFYCLGLYGIALGTVIAYLLDKILSVYFLSRRGIALNSYCNINLIIMSFVVLGILFVISHQIFVS